MTDKSYAVFLSYNSEDRDEVEKIAIYLEDEANLPPWFDEWHLIPGEPLIENLECGIKASSTCAIFVGKSGMGPWHNKEINAALSKQVRNPDFRVIPVLLPDAKKKPEDLPSFLSGNLWVIFRKEFDDDALYQLKCGIQGVFPGRSRHKKKTLSTTNTSTLSHLMGETKEVRGGLRMRSPVPDPTKHFLGREKNINKIIDFLYKNKIVAVTGAPGIGKTEIIKAIAHNPRTKSKFPDGIFWASAKEEENEYQLRSLKTMWDAILKVKGEKSRNLEEMNPEYRKKTVLNILENERTLLILDNFDKVIHDKEIIDFLRKLSHNSRVLIENRGDLDITFAKKYDLKPLGKDDSINLFRELLKDAGYFEENKNHESDVWVENICNILKGHPLALVIVANHTLKHSLKGIAERLQKQPGNILNNTLPGAPVKGLSKTIELSLNLIERSLNLDDVDKVYNVRTFFPKFSVFFEPFSFEDAKEVLGYQLSSPKKEKIKKYWLWSRFEQYFTLKNIREHLKVMQEEVLKNNHKWLSIIITLLQKLINIPQNVLNKRETELLLDKLVSYNLLEHKREYVLNNERDLYFFLPVIKMIANDDLEKSMPNAKTLHRNAANYYKTQEVPKSRRAIDHLKWLYQKSGDKKAGREAINFMLDVEEQPLYKGGFWEFDEEKLKEVIDISKAMADLKSEAKLLERLGCLYRHERNLVQAEKIHKKALNIFKNINHQEDIANQISKLGLINRDKGKLEKAEELLKEALEIHKRLGCFKGQARDFGNLGLVYRDKEKLKKAEEFINDALKFDDMSHCITDKADHLGYLGGVLRHQGRLCEAEDAHKKALKIHEKQGNLPGITYNLGRLGVIYQHQGKLDKAEQFLNNALAIDIKIKSFSGQAFQLTWLGHVYKSRGKLDKAEKVFKKVLDLDIKLNHKPGKARVLEYLGLVYKDMKKFNDAEEVIKNAMSIDNRLGNLTTKARCMEKLGLVYIDGGKLDKAENILKGALTICNKLENNYSKAWIWGDLGILYNVLERFDDAENALIEAQKIDEDLRNPCGQAWAWNHLGAVYVLKRDFVGAEKAHIDALSKYKLQDHLSGQAWSLDNLGRVYLAYGNQKMLKKAENAFKEALEINKILNYSSGKEKNENYLEKVYEKM